MGSKTDQELYINSKSTMSTTTSISGWNGHILPEQDSISRTTDASQQHRAYGIVHIAHIADAPVTTLNGSMLTPSKILAESYDNGFKKIEVRRTRTEKIPLLTLDKGKWENVTRRAHGERMYRYDSGPISRTPADGSATVNRQLLVIMKKKQPTMKFMQHLPNMVEFTRITPPPPFSTMISPILRRRIKITQKKIPPRVINPQIQSVNPLTIQVNSSTDNRQKFTRQEFSWTTTLPSIILPREFIQSTTPTFVLPKPTYSSAHSKTLHSHRLPATHKPTTRPTQLDQIRHYSENTARTFYYSRVVVPTNSSPKPSPQPTMYKSTTTVRPSVKSAEVRPMIIDAGKKFPLTNPFIPSHSSTNLRVEAESIEYLKPIIENVTAESPISKEKIISLSSHSFDDYDDQMDTNDFESYMIADSEIPTVAAYPQTISTSPSLFTKSSTIPPTTQLTTQLNIPPTRPPTTPLLRAKNWTPIVFPLNHDESLTTEEVVGQDYSEAVEFEIQTGGDHL